MKNISLGSLIILVVFSCAFAFHHSCPVNGCRDGPGRMKCQSCNTGCYGRDCRHVCRGECDSDGCDRTTGECFRCKPGMYGPGCSKGCRNDCPINSIAGKAYCNRQTGMCQEHCLPGKTGPTCHGKCPVNCKNTICSKLEGKCFRGCNSGWGGPYCNISCENCLQGLCAGDGYCTIHCNRGYYGDRCEKECPNCYTTGCDRRSGICEQCLPGYHGKHCDRKCSANCYQGRDGHRHCNRTNGHCLEGCESGYHDPHCKTPCNSNCRQNECYSSGHCTHPCEKGRYGSHCNTKCENCRSGCNRHSGLCIDGCKDRYHGERCDKECSHCAECDQKTERCIRCSAGFCGDSCTKPCSLNCEGDMCHINGTCINGCKKLHHGHLCENKCNQNCKICDQLSGDCVKCMQNHRLENGDCKLEPSYFSVDSLPNQSLNLATASAPFCILLYALSILQLCA